MERRTRQREAIRNALREANRPLSPQEILEKSADAAPGIGLATVYRSLKGWVDEGWLIPVHLPGEAPRYELAGKNHHHHFQCRECGKSFEVEASCPDEIEHMTPSGFVLESHELFLYGLCLRCAV